MGFLKGINMVEHNVITKMKYFCCALLIFLSNQAYSAPEKKCLEFHVINTVPIGYVNEEGKTTGVHWEYLEAVKKHSGLCINLKLMPYARIWNSLEYGNHDGGIIFKSQSRDKLVNYAGHIQTVPTVVIPLKGIKLSTYSDLNQLEIGTMRGVHLSKKFDNDKNLNLVKLMNFDQGTKMIKLKRVDAIAGNAFALMYQLQKFDVLEKVDLDSQLQLGEKEQWLQLSNKSQHLDLIPVLKQSITELKKNGVFREILIKYYGPYVAPK